MREVRLPSSVSKPVQAYPLKKPANFVPHFLGSLHATVTALARNCITIAWNAFPTARIPKIRPQSRVRKFAYRKAHFFIFFSGAVAALCSWPRSGNFAVFGLAFAHFPMKNHEPS